MNARTPLQKILDAILGADPTALAQTEPGYAAGHPPAPALPTTRVSAQRAERPLSRNEVALHGLKRALADFMASEARAYVSYYPNTRFKIEQITLIQTPENSPYLRELAAIKRKIRNGIALACIAEADADATVLDKTGFCDWNIEPATDATPDDQCVYTVVEGHGPEQVSLDFIIHGYYDEVQADAPGSIGLADQTPTLDPGPATPALLQLRIHEPGQAVRSLTAHQLPLLMGRGSACGVQLASPYLSRIHACIRIGGAGELLLENNSTKGTRLLGDAAPQDLALAETCALPTTGTLVLSPTATANAVRIEFECLSPAGLGDDQPTLEVPAQALRPGGTPPAGAVADAGPIVYLGGAAQPTLYQAERALARLCVRHGDGRIESVPIYSLPFVIGREPQGDNGLTVHDPSNRVSREHLRIERAQAGGFITENLAHGGGKGGTWRRVEGGGEALGPRFAWRPDPVGSTSGWHVLGQRNDGAGAVMVRLERAA